MKIETILCREGTMDNYAYLIIDEETGVSAIIDAPEVTNIANRCKKFGVRPKYILNTHHHFDHTDANLELKEIFGAQVVGAVYDEHRIPGIDITVKEGDIFKIGNLEAHIIKAPGHTKGHILWYFPKESASMPHLSSASVLNSSCTDMYTPGLRAEDRLPSEDIKTDSHKGILFTGDVLFNLCVGGLFEGTSAEMMESLAKIKALPDDVMFYPGHEYTIHAAGFAIQSGKGIPEVSEYINIAQERLDKGLPVGPISLGMEKKCNPYLRANTLEEIADLF